MYKKEVLSDILGDIWSSLHNNVNIMLQVLQILNLYINSSSSSICLFGIVFIFSGLDK